MKSDLVFENGVLFYCGIPVGEMRAYPIWLAARLAGCSHDTIWRARRQGKLKANAVGLIPRDGLDRWLNEEGSRRSPARKAQGDSATPRKWYINPEEQPYIPGLDKCSHRRRRRSESLN